MMTHPLADLPDSTPGWPTCRATPMSEQWVAVLAHELRDPLNAIGLALSTLQPVCAADHDARLAYDAVKHGSKHMARVLEDVLDLYRSGRGVLPIRKERVNLSPIVAGAIDAARPLFAAGGHRLSISLSQDHLCLDAHPSRLQQILTNLLTNAAKYTQPGGIIYLTAELEGSSIVMRVRDNGNGIEPELLPHVFEMHRHGTDARHGLGIGLALVKCLVELHDGSVEAFSDGPGLGSEFVVRLPCIEPIEHA
jgi:signal transduction histidine kinase